MNINLNILFYLKKPRGYNSGVVPVYMRITINYHRSEISVGREIEPSQWDTARRRAKGTREEIKNFNYHLDTVAARINEIYTQMIGAKEEITPENLKNAYLGKSGKPKMLFEIYEQHNAEMQQLVGNGFSENTLKAFRSSIKHLKAYVQKKHGLPDISIRKIDQSFIKGFEFYLRTKESPCIPISSDKYIKHLKKIVLLCLGNRWITENPFLYYKSTAKPTAKTFLTANELSTITNKQLDIARLKHVRDVFIFCCYTGLSYIDVQKLTSSEVGIGEKGERWIFTKRQKTEIPVRVPLLPIPLSIMDSYKSYPVCVVKSTLLPVYTNQRMNAYLKEIGDICGISKRLTFHMARHTFATTVTLSNGVPIETVSKMLGHNTIKTTQHYAKVLDSKTSYDMAILTKKLKAKNDQPEYL